jgi:hypothetical protein
MQLVSDSQEVKHWCDGTSITEELIDANKAMMCDSPIRQTR